MSLWLALLLCCCCVAQAWAQPITPLTPVSSAPPDAGAPTDPGAISTLIDSAVERLVQQAREDAKRKLAAKDFQGALKALQNAHELEPRNIDTTAQLSELQLLLGHAERAEALYRELIALDPQRGPAHVALADLLARDTGAAERLREAAELYARARELMGAEPSLLHKQARSAALRGLSDEAERAYLAYLAVARPDDALRLELGDFYRDAGRPDDAARWYREVVGKAPSRIAAQRIFELEVDREARRYGLSARDTRSTEQARAVAARARVAAGQGQLAQAEGLLRDALSVAPGLAILHANLAAVLQKQARSTDAELEYLRAIALDGTQPEVHLQLAELYLSQKPEQAVQAALLTERTLQLRPDWTLPHLLLARAYRAQGDLPRALLHVTRYLAQAAPSAERDDAVALQASLQALLGGAEPAQPGSTRDEPRSSDPLARARAFLARGKTDAALAELRRMDDAQRTLEALNLEASVLHAAGRMEHAAKVLQRSLARQDDQASVHEALADVLSALGRPAAGRAHLLSCERAGQGRCAFKLAKQDCCLASRIWCSAVGPEASSWPCCSIATRMPGRTCSVCSPRSNTRSSSTTRSCWLE